MASGEGVFPEELWEEGLKTMCGPLIDWNGNGQIDPSDIAITLAIAEEEEAEDENAGDDEQD